MKIEKTERKSYLEEKINNKVNNIYNIGHKYSKF